MRKKILATLLVGAVAAAGVIGFTACNDGNGGNEDNGGEEIKKGEQITETQWKAAMTATQNAENYTVTLSSETKETGEGTYEGKPVSYTSTENISAKLYYDLTGKKLYTDGQTKMKTTGAESVGETDIDKTTPRKAYEEIDGTTVWYGDFSHTDNTWSARSSDCGTEAAAKARFAEGGVAYLFEDNSLSQTAEGAKTTISELYSAFKYENGLYAATLYTHGEKAEFTVSVKGGYVLSVQSVVSFESEDNGMNYTSSMKAAYNFSDFGSTTVNAPAEAVQAIADAKAQAANPSVAGKTFVFDSIEYSYDANVSAEQRQQMESSKSEVEAMFANSKVIFGNNGDFTMPMNVQGQDMTAVGTYTQDGDNVVLTPVTISGQPAPSGSEPETMKLTGDLLKSSAYSEGITITMVYRLQNA